MPGNVPGKSEIPWAPLSLGIGCSQVSLPIVVHLGHDCYDALDFVLQLEVGAGRDIERLLFAACVDVLQDDRGAHPGSHAARMANNAEPARRRLLGVESGRLPNAAADFLDG